MLTRVLKWADSNDQIARLSYVIQGLSGVSETCAVDHAIHPSERSMIKSKFWVIRFQVFNCFSSSTIAFDCFVTSTRIFADDHISSVLDEK